MRVTGVGLSARGGPSSAVLWLGSRDRLGVLYPVLNDKGMTVTRERQEDVELVSVAADGRRAVTLGRAHDARITLWEWNEVERSISAIWTVPIPSSGTYRMAPVFGAQISADASSVMTVFYHPERSSQAQFWDVSTRTLRASHVCDFGYCFEASLSEDGSRGLLGFHTGRVSLICGRTGAELWRLPKDAHTERTHALDQMGSFLLTAAEDTTAILWDADLRKQVHVFRHRDPVRSAALSRRFAVTGADDGKVRLWSLKTGLCLAVVDIGHPQAVYKLAVTRDGKQAASIDCENDLRRWRPYARIESLMACLVSRKHPDAEAEAGAERWRHFFLVRDGDHAIWERIRYRIL